MRIIGGMSGTSADAIDVIALDVALAGDELRCLVLGHRAVALPPGLRADLLAALPPAPTSAAAVCRLDTGLGQAFAAAVQLALDEICNATADFAVISGQTFFHDVDGARCLGTLQLGQPSWVAERTGLPVVSDLRSRDVAAGGHGAPLVGLIDALLLAGRAGSGALNLGGIANLSVVAGASTMAYDIGPANALLDAAIAWRSTGVLSLDIDGQAAARGHVQQPLLDVLLADPFYALAPPRSTGKEAFHLPYLRDALQRSGAEDIETDDLLATLIALTASTVAQAVTAHGLIELLVSGGGCRNRTLMGELAARLPGVRLRRSEEFGIPEQAKEAFAFAVLGFLTVHGLPGALPSATGARQARILGSITPGAGPLVLPEPAAAGPVRIRVLDGHQRLA
ncbi:MAG: anhydro-N-acetylmuramic acid kinase [Pseudonocardiales bacterium]